MSQRPFNFICGFEPLQYVTVSVHNVRYRGRVMECIVVPGGFQFLVEFVDDKGDFQTRRFYGDELTATEK